MPKQQQKNKVMIDRETIITLYGLWITLPECDPIDVAIILLLLFGSGEESPLKIHISSLACASFLHTAFRTGVTVNTVARKFCRSGGKIY